MDTEGPPGEPAAAGEGTSTAEAEKLAREHARGEAEEPPLTDQELTVLRGIQAEATDVATHVEAEEVLGHPLSADERQQIAQPVKPRTRTGGGTGGGMRTAWGTRSGRPRRRAPGRPTTNRPATRGRR